VSSVTDPLTLLDYRRRMHDLYARVRRAGTSSPGGFDDFIATRDALFARHPQSPLPADRRPGFGGLDYVPYDPRYRFVAPLDRGVKHERLDVRLAADGVVTLERFARVHVPFPAGTAALSLFWIGGYGGGLFLPFRDATNGHSTYGGGRYLLDTIKGADLGSDGDAVVLDFNYAYHPSCAYDARWDCPLAPPENRLVLAVEAGERYPWREDAAARPGRRPPRVVELFYFDGCASWREAWRDLGDVVAETGVDAQVRLRDVTTLGDEPPRGFAGSPTIHVDGVDLEGYDGPGVMACRRYEENGGKGSPSPGLLKARLSAGS
jgi:uncharacterized protein